MNPFSFYHPYTLSWGGGWILYCMGGARGEGAYWYCDNPLKRLDLSAFIITFYAQSKNECIAYCNDLKCIKDFTYRYIYIYLILTKMPMYLFSFYWQTRYEWGMVRLGEVLPLTMFNLKKLVGERVILWQRHSSNDSQGLLKSIFALGNWVLVYVIVSAWCWFNFPSGTSSTAHKVF